MTLKKILPAGALCLTLLLLPSLGNAAGKVAVLPFLSRGSEGEERLVPSLEGRSFFRSGELPPYAPSLLTRLLWRKLREADVDLLPLSASEEVARGGALRKDPLGAALAMGRKMGTWGVVVGAVYRFREREGSSVGVIKPASVAFEALLIRIADGRVIWRVQADETQRSLSENLLQAGTFFRKGIRWLKAEELASLLIEKEMEAFPLR